MQNPHKKLGVPISWLQLHLQQARYERSLGNPILREIINEPTPTQAGRQDKFSIAVSVLSFNETGTEHSSSYLYGAGGGGASDLSFRLGLQSGGGGLM